MSEKLSDRYLPSEVEEKIYKKWEDSRAFKAQDQSTRPPFCVVLPPPNVTGFLHMGHALDHTIQDILVRWKRMSGFNTLWLPGSDHAGIATQAVVEKELRRSGQSRLKMGRKAFVQEVWKWKNKYGDRIYSQMKRLGDSVDWSRACFTLDKDLSKAVRKVFVHLYKKGWLYKGEKLVNWSPPLQSAISDLEVVHRETKGQLYYLAYPVENSSEKIIIATTRPETYFGDSCVCVHPKNQTFSHLIGKKAVLPLINRKIPIIADESVDREFGTGALKVTPAHDFKDYKLGEKHNLEFINILNPDGTLNEKAGIYKGLTVQKARQALVKDLKEKKIIIKAEAHRHNVGYCDRTGAVVEPYLSKQWFVKVKDLAVPARHVVSNENLQFIPNQWEKTYIHWLNIIEDWCISRQLWWGHRIPAWTCADCHQLTVSEEEEVSVCEFCGSSRLKQDEDVLDTWFSSALWPFSTLGWPEKTEALKTFYPTSVLVTGHDIIFFWVARMIMMGLEVKGDIPFRKVFIHGLIRDQQGRKMSKSLGNSVDPVEMIEKYGADALRLALISQMAMGKDLKFSIQKIESSRNFMNKLWNAFRFCLSHIEKENFNSFNSQKTESSKPGLNDFPESVKLDQEKESLMTTADRWLIYQMGLLEKNVNQFLEDMRFSDAVNTLYSFTWHEFCDWYLEFSKPTLYGNDKKQKQVTLWVLIQTLSRLIRLLHPFIPFITEEIYSKLQSLVLKSNQKLCATEGYPAFEKDQEWLSLASAEASFEMELVKQVITAIRNIRGENRIKPLEKLDVWLCPKEEEAKKLLIKNQLEIVRLAVLKTCEIKERESLKKCAVSPIRMNHLKIDVVIPLEGFVDFEKEIKRLNKLIEKQEKEMKKINSRLEHKDFIKNAPGEVIENDKKLLREIRLKVDEMKKSLSRF